MSIEDQLNLLAEFEAQKSLIGLDKQKLLDEVRVPQEVLNAQDEANKARQAVDAAMWARQKLTDKIRNDSLAQVVDPEMPPEFVAALEAARQKRAEIMAASDAQNVTNRLEADNAKSSIEANLLAQTQAIYRQIAIRKAEIEAEFGDKAAAVDANIAKLTAEIKAAVIAEGKTVKGSVYQAVFVKGRDGGWNTDKLTGYAASHPEIIQFKKPDGEPSCTLRKL